MVAAARPARKEATKQVSQSYMSLVWWKFKKNKIAVFGGILLLVLYIGMCLFAEFISPYALEHSTNYLQARPQTIRFIDRAGQILDPAVCLRAGEADR